MNHRLKALAAALCVTASGSAYAQSAPTALPPPTALPSPSANPLVVDRASDPILRLARSQAPMEIFRSTIATAVDRHPRTREQGALRGEARAVLSEANEALYPTVDINLTSYRVIARDFSNDPGNIVERSRPQQRTDAIVSVQQTVLDWGASGRRVEAAGARLRAAAAEVEVAADQVALSAIASWYDVFAYRALVALTQAFIANQADLRAAVQERIAQGVSAESDLARVESYIASAQTRIARFQRQLSTAEARFTELIGAPPPAALERAPVPNVPNMTRDMAVYASLNRPLVESAESVAEAARLEARAARAERLPQVSAGIDAGRYGVYETERDYDIRGRVALRQRFFGGVNARIARSDARALASEARAARVREEASRDAAIAWADVQALEAQLAALEEAYIASRRSRDALIERFRAARGSLFDVVAAEDAYFEAATSYVQAITELDAARYVLLSRTDRLLETLAIEPNGGQEIR